MTWRRVAMPRRYAWQVLAVAAFAGTAVLAVALARPRAAVMASASVAPCTALDARVGQVSDARLPPGVRYYLLEFTNVSARTCTLAGYPAVAAYRGSRRIGGPAAQDDSVPPHTVTLRPGASAHALLRYTDRGLAGQGPAGGCREVSRAELRVRAPRQAVALSLPLQVPACAPAAQLTVQPILP